MPRRCAHNRLSPASRASITCAILLALTACAHAGLLNTSVKLDDRFPDTATVIQNYGTQLVDPSADYLLASAFDQDFLFGTVTDHQLVIHNISTTITDSFFPASFNGFVLTSIDGPAFASAAINSLTTLSGVTSADLTLTDHSLFVNLESLVFTPGQNLTIDLTFADATAAPAPGIAVTGAALFSTLLATRSMRRSRATT